MSPMGPDDWKDYGVILLTVVIGIPAAVLVWFISIILQDWIVGLFRWIDSPDRVIAAVAAGAAVMLGITSWYFWRKSRSRGQALLEIVLDMHDLIRNQQRSIQGLAGLVPQADREDAAWLIEYSEESAERVYAARGIQPDSTRAALRKALGPLRLQAGDLHAGRRGRPRPGRFRVDDQPSGSRLTGARDPCCRPSSRGPTKPG